MPVTKSGIDKPTGRVVVLIVLLILAAGSLRGYLPARDGSPLAGPGGSRAAMMIIVAALAATVALLAVAIAARLRDPRTVAPSAGDISEMLGGGRGRPNWRVVFIGLGVILAWLLFATLLARLFTPPDVSPPASTPDSGDVSPSVRGTGPPPDQQPQDDTGDMLGILLAGTVPLLVMIVIGAAITARRRRALTPRVEDRDDTESRASPARSESLLRAAEVGLAEMADLSREPREAIIACYAAMEGALANVPGAVPEDFDTPTEVLARAVERKALRADNAVQLVNLFAEARFSHHVMNEGHREVAVRTLRLVLDELAPQSRGSRRPGSRR